MWPSVMMTLRSNERARAQKQSNCLACVRACVLTQDRRSGEEGEGKRRRDSRQELKQRSQRRDA